MQHPDRYCVSAKSLAAHLTGLAWAIEHGGDDSGLRALQRALDGRVELVKPALPTDRGRLTIANLASAVDTDAYLAGLDAWARSTWKAYGPLHQTAREWIAMAFAG